MMGKAKKVLFAAGIFAVAIGVVVGKKKQKKMILLKRRETDNR